MPEPPENIDLQWLGREMLALRRDVRGVRDDIAVMAAILRRVENNQTSDREEWHGLFEAVRHLRERMDRLENPT